MGNTLFIRNLAFELEEYEIRDYFSQYGEIEYAKVIRNFLLNINYLNNTQSNNLTNLFYKVV